MFYQVYRTDCPLNSCKGNICFARTRSSGYAEITNEQIRQRTTRKNYRRKRILSLFFCHTLVTARLLRRCYYTLLLLLITIIIIVIFLYYDYYSCIISLRRNLRGFLFRDVYCVWYAYCVPNSEEEFSLTETHVRTNT